MFHFLILHFAPEAPVNFHFGRLLPSFKDFSMSARQVATMTFYFTRRLVVLPFHPQNVTHDSITPRNEKLTKMSYLRLEPPTTSLSSPMSFFGLTTFQPRVYFQMWLHMLYEYDAPLHLERKQKIDMWQYEKRNFRCLLW